VVAPNVSEPFEYESVKLSSLANPVDRRGALAKLRQG